MTIDELLSIPIEELELGVRAYNICKRCGVDTLGDVLSLTINDCNHMVTQPSYMHGPCNVLGLRAYMQLAEAQDYVRSLL